MRVRGARISAMETYSIKVAKDSLSQLVSDAQQGKTVIIKTESGRAVKLVPTSTGAIQSRKAGSARGKVVMSEDFDEPLDDFAKYME